MSSSSTSASKATKQKTKANPSAVSVNATTNNKTRNSEEKGKKTDGGAVDQEIRSPTPMPNETTHDSTKSDTHSKGEDVSSILMKTTPDHHQNTSGGSGNGNGIVLSIDEHPLVVGNFLVVKYRDGSHRLAKIIETAETSVQNKNNNNNNNDNDSSNGMQRTITYMYYVHYVDFNRRMDEWITCYDRIIMFPSEANVLELAKRNGHQNIQGNLECKRLLQDTGDDSFFPIPKKLNGSSNSSSQNLVSLGGQHGSGGSTVITSDNRRRSNRSSTHDDMEGDDSDDNDNDGGIDDDDDDDDGDDDYDDAQPTTVAELEHDEHEGLDEKSLLEHEEITKVKNIAYVLFGRHIMECWYFSPFPKEFTNNGPVAFLYFCEFTLRFFCTKDELIRFQNRPNLPRHPPGNEIYRDTNVSMFELDGAVEKIYCQNLCFFAKLFLDHKTLYWDVDPFLFYVLCAKDERGYHPVGFYSKEK